MSKIISFLIPVALVMSACESTQVNKKLKGNYWARVTYYTGHEDKWGTKVACSKKIRACQGRTCAAHSDFPFWTRIFIPLLKGKIGNGHFVVEDRGSAVESKKAAHGTAYDFDVYLAMSNKAMKRFASTMPPYMEVQVQ